jgi:hypothetical protein
MRSLITIIGLVAMAGFSGCSGKDVPVEHRLADCTNSTLRFWMTIQEFAPYQFVLGIPQTTAGQMSFRGEVLVSQSTGTVARLPISSDDVTPCNWLSGLSGYILTWNTTNRLESFLTRGQTYDVEVRFSELPPPESSFWLSAMGRVRL